MESDPSPKKIMFFINQNILEYFIKVRKPQMKLVKGKKEDQVILAFDFQCYTNINTNVILKY